MSKVILISQIPLPFSGIGSWTTLYKNYLEANHKIDYVVCQKPDTYFETITYENVQNNFIEKILKRVQKNHYIHYVIALKKILKSDEKYIIQIIDNFGIVKPLISFLEKSEFRKQCYLQFFYHGFPPFHENFHGRWFYESIDEMVLLTHDSYKAHKNYYTILPCRFSFLHNGVDTSRFFKLSSSEKLIFKQKHNVLDKKVFVWCSQDRPKKGLFLLLDAWKNVYKTRQDIVLWVIGCEPKSPQDGVEFLGRIPNNELPNYFQTSDCYLFPTLCHEGFGMSLIEALHCGNFCIASAIGGIPEVLQYGKLGKLIENSHFVSEWEAAILDYLENDTKPPIVSSNLYSSQSWNSGMNNIIEKAKTYL